jgi:hypothetical protein
MGAIWLAAEQDVHAIGRDSPGRSAFLVFAGTLVLTLSTDQLLRFFTAPGNLPTDEPRLETVPPPAAVRPPTPPAGREPGKLAWALTAVAFGGLGLAQFWLFWPDLTEAAPAVTPLAERFAPLRGELRWHRESGGRTTGVPRDAAEPTYQVQLFLESYARLTTAEQDEALAFFQRIRAQFGTPGPKAKRGRGRDPQLVRPAAAGPGRDLGSRPLEHGPGAAANGVVAARPAGVRIRRADRRAGPAPVGAAPRPP